MSEAIVRKTIDIFLAGDDLSRDQIELFFDALISGSDESLIARSLAAWNEKGTSEDELFEFASIMRRRMKKLPSRYETFVDIVGTGGSKVKTFNISTAAAFVIAGAGVPVAKHGNRAATSNSGSADVLAELGIDVDLETHITEKQFNDYGICFMFAPRFHSLSPTLAKARRSIDRPTIFNNLGPLCNPASAPHQVIGVWHESMIGKTSTVLRRFGAKRSWVVHGENGLDEISLTGKTLIAEINGDDIKHFQISHEDFGIDLASGILPSGCDAVESASLIRQIVGNCRAGSNEEKLVLMNAAAAIYLCGGALSLAEAYTIAEAGIRNGSAKQKLDLLTR